MSQDRAQNATQTKQAWVTPEVKELPTFTDLTLQSGGVNPGPIISGVTDGSNGTFSFV